LGPELFRRKHPTNSFDYQLLELRRDMIRREERPTASFDLL
jgi:hypothetical protein